MTMHNWSIGPQAQLSYNDLDGSIQIVTLQTDTVITVTAMRFEDFRAFQFFIDTLQSFKNTFAEELIVPIPAVFLRAFTETEHRDSDGDTCDGLC